jgi:spore coat protein U-like protein
MSECDVMMQEKLSKRQNRLILAAFALVQLLPATATAANPTQFPVSGNVPASCTLTPAGNIAFSYNPITNDPQTGTTTSVSWNCTPGESPTFKVYEPSQQGSGTTWIAVGANENNYQLQFNLFNDYVSNTCSTHSYPWPISASYNLGGDVQDGRVICAAALPGQAAAPAGTDYSDDATLEVDAG